MSWSSIRVLAWVSHYIVDTYLNVKLSLTQQVQNLSALAHLLFVMHRSCGKKFITGVLYHDFQVSIQDVIISIARMQCDFASWDPKPEYFISTQGTDELEQLFGIARTITHNRNFPVLEFAGTLATARSLKQIYMRHPSWKERSRRLDTVERVSPRQVPQGVNLRVDSVNLKAAWDAGRVMAQEVLRDTHDGIEEQRWWTDLERQDVTLRRPRGRLVGVKGEGDGEVDAQEGAGQFSSAAGRAACEGDEEDGDEDDFIDSDMANAAAEESQIGVDGVDGGVGENVVQGVPPMMEIGGKLVHKASAVRFLSESGAPLRQSSDRLRRVRGFTHASEKQRIGTQFVTAGGEESADLFHSEDVFAVIVLSKGKLCVVLAVGTGPIKIKNGKTWSVTEEVLREETTEMQCIPLRLHVAPGTMESETECVYLGAPIATAGFSVYGQDILPLNLSVVLPNVSDTGRQRRNAPPPRRAGEEPVELRAALPNRPHYKVTLSELKAAFEELRGGVRRDLARVAEVKIAGCDPFLPYHPQLGELLESEETATTTGKCGICGRSIKLLLMRSHIALHVFKGDCDDHADMCGFCGKIGESSCNFIIKQKKRKEKGLDVYALSVKRDRRVGRCLGFHERTRWSTAAKGSPSNPSTNVPIKCPVCEEKPTFIWKLNMKKHMSEVHPGKVLNDEEAPAFEFSDEEIKQLKEGNGQWA